jgi:cyclic beta-1,2-glucan synthetase
LKILPGRTNRPSLWTNKRAIREELFSVERLEAHGRSLAAAQAVAAKPIKGYRLAGRLADNATVLLKSHTAIAQVADEGGAITPAGLWLLDNYYLVERQIHDIRSNLPSAYYRQLPKLIDGPFAGYPRVMGVAWAFVAHTDSHFDPEILCRYVSAYQEVQPLTIGELWALAITLRIVLIENLRRLAETIVCDRTFREQADALADRLLGSELPPPAMPGAVPLPDAFAVQFVYRLRDQDPKITPALTWLDQRLAASGTTADAIVHDELQRQGAASVTVQNIITSMRLISDVEWTDLIERLSLVDGVLAAGTGFANMDFATRNLYRSAIEELARGSDLTEIAIARCAVGAADQALDDPRHRDPGYHLLAGGRFALEATIGFQAPFRSRLRRVNSALGIGVSVWNGSRLASFPPPIWRWRSSIARYSGVSARHAFPRWICATAFPPACGRWWLCR